MIEHLPGIPGFSTAPHTHLGETREVYRRGHGPAVIVMSEIPGITPQVAGFAGKVADAGFSVWMPQLFGTPLRPISAGYLAQSLAKICIGREFSLLAANQSSPIVDWLRALAREAHEACGGPGIGAIGMCFSGNFALTLALERKRRKPSPPSALPSLSSGRNIRITMDAVTRWRLSSSHAACPWSIWTNSCPHTRSGSSSQIVGESADGR